MTANKIKKDRDLEISRDDLRTLNNRLNKLTARVLMVLEEERVHIAREIHDELSQQLTVLRIDAAWVGRKVSPDNKSVQERLSGMISLIDETVKTMRRISSGLRIGVLDTLGLVTALAEHTEQFEQRTGITTDFTSSLMNFNPERHRAINIFRIYQEALTNIARHAHATKVETVLDRIKGHFRLIVKDNGQGFDWNEAKERNTLGLIGMQERALILGGTSSSKAIRT